MRCGLTKLVNSQPQNLQDIRKGNNVCRGNQEKLESGINSWKKRISIGENLSRYIQGKCAITVTIYNGEDATQSLMKWIGGNKLTKSQEKIKKQMYMDEHKVFVKNKTDP